MKCVYLVDDLPCDEQGSKYMNIYLCDVHIDAIQCIMGNRVRATALQAAECHNLDDFPGLCYIALLPDGAVKIGYSNSEDLYKRRMKVLSRQYGAPVIPLATIKGGFVAEAVLHSRFKADRIPGLGERFRYSPELAEFIASVR